MGDVVNPSTGVESTPRHAERRSVGLRSPPVRFRRVGRHDHLHATPRTPPGFDGRADSAGLPLQERQGGRAAVADVGVASGWRRWAGLDLLERRLRVRRSIGAWWAEATLAHSAPSAGHAHFADRFSTNVRAAGGNGGRRSIARRDHPRRRWNSWTGAASRPSRRSGAPRLSAEGRRPS